MIIIEWCLIIVRESENKIPNNNQDTPEYICIEEKGGKYQL